VIASAWIISNFEDTCLSKEDAVRHFTKKTEVSFLIPYPKWEAARRLNGSTLIIWLQARTQSLCLRGRDS